MDSTFTYTSDFVDGEVPSLTVRLDMLNAAYPCVAGTTYAADAMITMKNFEDIENLDELADISMQAYLYCKPDKKLPAFKLYGTVDSITVKKNNLTNITMRINVYQ
jgi:hypothetical protein